MVELKKYSCFSASFLFSPYFGGPRWWRLELGLLLQDKPIDPEGEFVVSREGNNHRLSNDFTDEQHAAD